MKQTMKFNLLTVMGKVKPITVEATRELHNHTAGHPDGVATAKKLGDLSHMIYMPVGADKEFDGQLLFLDIWNNLEGMNQFFSDKQVQGGADMMFETREAVVWNKLDHFLNFSFPAPTGNNERVVGMIRGFAKSLDEAEEIHNAGIAKNVLISRGLGHLSHNYFVRAAAPGSPEALEVLGLDVWMDGKGMMDYYMGANYQAINLNGMFSGKPTSSIWRNPGGSWVEW